MFWPNFGWFDPFSIGVTQRSSKGQNFKMLQMTFRVYQITREVIRITKIYSLLCVGVWLGRYQRKFIQRSSVVKFSKTSDLHEWHIKLFLSACTFQKYILLNYLSFHFWNKPICLNSDRDCSGRSSQVQNGDYNWLQEIDNPHNSVNRLNWFCFAYNYSYQICFRYYFVLQQ